MNKKLLSTFLFLGLSASAVSNFAPYVGEPPEVVLTAAQQADVAAGKLVYLLDNTAGEIKEGSVVFRVNASEDKIWAVLSDFSKYSQWSYRVGDAKATDLGDNRFLVNFMTDSLGKHYFVLNNFPKKDWATWNTDHSKSNDCVLDTVGFWRVRPVNAQQSDVIQYGKLRLTNLCANGFFGIGGFDAHDMATTIYKNLRARAEAL